MVPFATAHPYEISFFVVSAVSVTCAIGLFVLKLSDLFLLKASGQNGATEFNVTEKVRKQGFLLAISCVLLHMALTSINNPVEPTVQALNLLGGGIFIAVMLIIDAYFTFRKRRRLPMLIAKERTVRGGRRSTDPPL